MIVADYGRDRTKSTASLLQPLATMNCAVGVDYVAGNDGLCGIVRTNGSPSLHESRWEGGRGGRLVQVSSPKRSVRVWGTIYMRSLDSPIIIRVNYSHGSMIIALY